MRAVQEKYMYKTCVKHPQACMQTLDKQRLKHKIMVQLLYAQEHLSCPNYDAGQYPAIEEIRVAPGEIRRVFPHVNKLVFVLDGHAQYSTGQVQRYPARKGNIFFLASNRNLWYSAVEDTRLLIIRLFGEIRFCDCFSVEHLHRMENEKSKVESSALSACPEGQEKATGVQQESFHLEVNPVMEKYLELLTLCRDAGLQCRYYHEGKIRELMYIFRAFYPKEDLRRFFAPALAADARFSQQVMSSYSRYGNLAEIAAAMNYSISGFEKKFRKVFGCSPYNWMVRQKAQEAWHCVHTEDLNIKEIAARFGFSSAAAFNKFFAKHFGISPGTARKDSAKRRE